MKNDDDLKKIIFDNYNIRIKNLSILTGGWMNKKYLCEDLAGNKYVIKLFSPKKVEKMSNGEFSSDYLDNQLSNNLKIENYMYNNNLNCEQISINKNNEILTPYGDYRIAVIGYLNGDYVSKDKIKSIQLYNLGQECAKMHLLFKNVASEIYIGDYLKMPSIEKLHEQYESKKEKCSIFTSQQYLDLLHKQKKNLLLLNKIKIINDIPISVTHGDFADDNILFEDDILKILDFELVRLNSPLLDIGRIIMSYCYEKGRMDYSRINSFMLGYNNVLKINDNDIFLSLVTVWINEVDMWIKENYFNKKITEKSKRFQDELIYLTYSLPYIIQYYINDKTLNNFCDSEKERILIK